MHETTLWDGRRVWCYGFREGLPVFKYLTAPIGLVTRTQLGEQQLRRRRGQDPVALLVFHKAGCGEQVAPLYVLEHAVPARTKTSALLDSVAAMNLAHRTCRRCKKVFDRYLPTSTWMCGMCMKATGDYGAGDRAA